MLFVIKFLIFHSLGLYTLGHCEEGRRIKNGHNVKPGEIPYQVSIQMINPPSHFCGGAIISRYYVVTAAHCLEGMRKHTIAVVAGTVNLVNPKVVRYVKKIILHEDWNDQAVANDIALIEISEPVIFTKYLKPIRLPNRSGDFQNADRAMLSGFGAHDEREHYDTILLRTYVRVYKSDVCTKRFYYSLFRSISSSELCSHCSKGGGSCPGDSGGPIVLNDRLIALVSWGVGACSTKKHPGIDVRVASYLDWLKRHMVKE